MPEETQGNLNPMAQLAIKIETVMKEHFKTEKSPDIVICFVLPWEGKVVHWIINTPKKYALKILKRTTARLNLQK